MSGKWMAFREISENWMVLARGGVGKERDCNKWYKFSFTCEIYYLADFDQKMAWSNDILNPFNSPSSPLINRIESF